MLRSTFTKTPARVLAVDDNPAVGEALGSFFTGTSRFVWAGFFVNADELVEKGPGLNPDLVLLDLDMPGSEPLKALERFLELSDSCRVLVLSGHLTRGRVDAALDAGAFGYVWKNDGLDEMYRCMDEALAGRLTFSESVGALFNA